MAALDFSAHGTPVEKPLDFSAHGDPVDAPTPVRLMGPMAADAAAISPLAKADPNADSIGKAFQGAQDVGSTLATRLTPAAMLPMLAGGAAGISSLAGEHPAGGGLADAFLPLPVKMGMALANPEAASRAADAVTRTEQPLNYQPQTEAGNVAAAAPDYVYGKIGEGADYLGQKTTDFTGSPLAGAGVSTAAQLLPLLLGERAVRGGVGAAKAVRAADLSRGDPNVMANIDADMAGKSDTAIDTTPNIAGFNKPVNSDAMELQDLLNKSATDTPAPSAADSLKAMADQVKTTIAQGLAPKPPVETPPPALAAKEQANAANRPLATKPGGGGAGTGLDTAQVSPESAARAAVLEEKPDAAPPLHPWTPVDATKPVPLAGGVVEPEVPGGPQKVAIDPRIPQFVKVDGKDIDAHEAIGLHERTEKTLMEQGLDYADAHDLATKAENAFVAKKYGIDPQTYQDALKPHIANALKEASNDPSIPPTLDTKPYTDEGDEGLLKNDSDLTDVRNSYLKGLSDEIGWDQEGGKLLRAPLKEGEGALGDVTGRTTWEPKGRSDGNGASHFWQSYKLKEGSNGLTIAGAKEALRKHLAGESLTPKEKRFADFAEDHATKYMSEYADDRAAGDTLSRQEAKETAHPPTDYSEYTTDYKPEDSVGGFTPQERHSARLDALLSKLGPITDEQKAALTAHHGNVELDPVMGLPTRKELVPTIEAAKSEGGPASYGEVDIRGVGSLNAHMGSNSAADPHLKAIAQIVQRNVDDAANAFGGRAVVVRKGGDELGVIAHGIDPADLHRALGKARREVDAYAKQNGLDKAKSAKVGGQDGVGLHYGVSRITPDADIGSIIGDADTLVEARKKGAEGYEYTGQTATIGPKSSGGQAGRTIEGAGGGGGAGTGARGALSDSAFQGEPTGTETAVAERPVTEAAKPPPTKTAEAAAKTEPAKPEGTQVRNAAVDAQRDELGLAELPPAEREHWQDASDQARSGISNGDIHPRTLAAEVAAKPRALTTVETMALAHDLKSLSEERASAVSDALAARERGDTVAEAQALLRKRAAVDAMETNHAALRNGGTEAGRALSIRNAILKDDYTIGRNMDRAKLAYGDKFNDALRKQVETLSDELEKAQAEAARLQKAAESRRSASKAKMTDEEKTQARLQAQIDKLQKTIEERTRLCPI